MLVGTCRLRHPADRERLAGRYAPGPDVRAWALRPLRIGMRHVAMPAGPRVEIAEIVASASHRPSGPPGDPVHDVADPLVCILAPLDLANRANLGPISTRRFGRPRDLGATASARTGRPPLARRHPATSRGRSSSRANPQQRNTRKNSKWRSDDDARGVLGEAQRKRPDRFERRDGPVAVRILQGRQRARAESREPVLAP